MMAYTYGQNFEPTVFSAESPQGANLEDLAALLERDPRFQSIVASQPAYTPPPLYQQPAPPKAEFQSMGKYASPAEAYLADNRAFAQSNPDLQTMFDTPQEQFGALVQQRKVKPEAAAQMLQYELMRGNAPSIWEALQQNQGDIKRTAPMIEALMMQQNVGAQMRAAQNKQLKEYYDLQEAAKKAKVPVALSDYDKEIQRGEAKRRNAVLDAAIPGTEEHARLQRLNVEKAPVDSERIAAYHVGKMMTSLQRVKDLSAKDPTLLTPSWEEAFAASIPGLGAYSGTANLARSPERQAIFAKQTDMIDSLLFLATGAAYNKEQLEQKRNSLLPSFTDSPKARQEKQIELADYMQQAKIRAGKAWTPELEIALQGLFNTTPVAPPTGAPAAPQQPRPPVAPAPAPAQQQPAPLQIVKEVPLKDGRIGVIYSDGSRGYKQ